MCHSSNSAQQLSDKYGISSRSIRSIRKNGAGFYQKKVNLGGRSRKRERGFNKDRHVEMEKINEILLGELDGMRPITKHTVLHLMEERGVFRSDLYEKAKEETYHRFKYVFGWTNRKFGKAQCISPKDIDNRIKVWAKKFYVQHTVRKYNYVLFGDELRSLLTGQPQV